MFLMFNVNIEKKLLIFWSYEGHQMSQPHAIVIYRMFRQHTICIFMSVV